MLLDLFGDYFVDVFHDCVSNDGIQLKPRHTVIKIYI